MLDRPSPPVSLHHPCLGRIIQRNGKRWKVASVHMSGGSFWAWMVNLDNRKEQVRLSVKALDDT